MEKSENFDDRWSRILDCTNTTSDSALAKILGILPQSVSAARKRRQIPSGWMEKISLKFGVTTDWLFFGREPQFVENQQCPSSSLKFNGTSVYGQPIEFLIEKLEKELECERRERREVSAENRQLHAEKDALLKENGELKAENARLDERLKAAELGEVAKLEGEESRIA